MYNLTIKTMIKDIIYNNNIVSIDTECNDFEIEKIKQAIILLMEDENKSIKKELSELKQDFYKSFNLISFYENMYSRVCNLWLFDRIFNKIPYKWEYFNSNNKLYKELEEKYINN